jgi:hypothetical protein
MGELSEDVLMATFAGMGGTIDDVVYFDKEKIDVLTYVNGYLSSMLGDQSESNRILANRISNGDERDYIDENRYVLIDRLLLTDFLTEYKNQSNGKEPFYSFSELFSKEVIKDFTYDKSITINQLTFTNHIQQKFHKIFGENYQSRVSELKEDYTSLFEITCDKISEKWINKKVLNQTDMTEKELCDKIAENLKMQIENEFDTKVFECGSYSKNSSEFTELQPMGAIPPENAEHIFYFLIPLDDADNIIFNNYHQLYQATQGGLMFSPSSRRAVDEFQRNLREDIELVNFISKAIDNRVYPIGSRRVSNYKPTDNIVENAEKIDDLRYRYFRFYLPKMT